MPYLIDGHNLIPKIAGMSLSQLDDEQRLLDLLVTFQRVKRAQVEVFFDRAVPGGACKKSVSGLTAHFVFRTSSADQAIARRLAALGRAARNWIVVSSDRQVQEEARSHQAAVLSSENFARELEITHQVESHQSRTDPPRMHPDEVEEWLEFFNDDETP
jgi:hypothetical protein